MKPTIQLGAIITAALTLLSAAWIFACSGRADEPADDPTAAVEMALGGDGGDAGSGGGGGGVTSTNLELTVSKNACASNTAQDFFDVLNASGAPVKLSDITIKYWVFDTSSAALAASVSYGGCVTSQNGTCVHPVSGVKAAATTFSPACGADAAHQANWEITVSTTDTTPLGAGQTWTGVQTALNLSNFASFKPGTATWYSRCGTGGAYASDPHFAVYVRGDLVDTSGITAPSCRAPRGQQHLSGYFTPSLAAAPVVGPVPPSTVLSLAIGLPLRNEAQLESFAAAVSDPTSPTYQQYITPQTFTATYGPTAADYAALVAWAQTHNLHVVTYPNNVVADLTGTALDFDAALFVNFQLALRPDGSQFIEIDRDPSLDLSLPVASLSGTDSFEPLQPFSGSFPGNGMSGQYGPGDIRNAYLGAACSTQTGKGQTIGLIEGAGFTPGDIASYISLTNLATAGFSIPPLQVQTSNDPNGLPPTQAPPIAPDGSSGNAEAAADIEMCLALAPEAQIIVFEGGQFDSVLANIANNPDVKQVSSSVGAPLTQTTTSLLLQLAAQGQSFFQASGDSGAFEPPGMACTAAGIPTPPVGRVRSSPWATLTGGTSLFMAGTGASYIGEAAWAGSGGGILPNVPLPAYQMNIATAFNGASTQFRNLPDVAALATDVFTVITDCNHNLVAKCDGGIITGDQFAGGGTSLAAPLWAAFTALVNEVGASNSDGSIGFANPLLYHLAQDPMTYAQTFHDVTPVVPGFTVNAFNLNVCGFGYHTTSGYDLVTGLGTPSCALLQKIAGPAVKPFVDAAMSQDQLFGLAICGHGIGFTPNGTVTVQYGAVPKSDGTELSTPAKIATLTADATGRVSFADLATFDFNYIIGSGVTCTPAQCATPVNLQVTDVSSGISINSPLPVEFWCIDNPNPPDPSNPNVGTCSANPGRAPFGDFTCP
jgi:hypothetical protein